MLFTGEHEHTIDAQHRLAIPAEWRGQLSGGGGSSDDAPDSDDSMGSTDEPSGRGPGVVYLVSGPNGALWLWPGRTFEAMAGAMEQSLLPAEETMEFEELSLLPGGSVGNGQSRPDSTSRTSSVKRVGIDARVVVLGVKDHLELRDPTDWEQRREAKLAQQGEIMLRARRALATQRRDGGTKDGAH